MELSTYLKCTLRFFLLSIVLLSSVQTLAFSQPPADADSDGISDTEDSCPDTPNNQAVNASGCALSQIDSDNDGRNDSIDAFPNDPTEWSDIDADNIGDNTDLDRDGDDISNDYENQVGTDPNNSSSTPPDLDNDRIPDALDIDIDGDGVVNNLDGFPRDPFESNDLDQDGIGDNSDPDKDGDGIPNAMDVFPTDPNEWFDLDGDGIGDNTDLDRDGDGVANVNDVFPDDSTESKDIDNDGIGDNTDTDRDGDGVLNSHDTFPDDIAESSDIDGDGIGDNADIDRDGDGVPNSTDAFPSNAAETSDLDNDGIGDNSDTDRDGDGVLNANDSFPDDATESSDIDSDGIGDNADTDRDGDGVLNIDDAFPQDAEESSDLDGDGIGDNSDSDLDGDGVENDEDVFPLDASEAKDTDEDGVGDNADNDRDGDGIENDNDAFPLDATESADLDNDGIGDNTDIDRDGDGVSNDVEIQVGTNPDDASSVPVDLDGDGIPNALDSDIDGDGVENLADAFPENAQEWTDLDGDGIGDNSDPDLDGDGHANIDDTFPQNPQEWADLDGDGTGDNTDTDTDGDGVLNSEDAFPRNPDENSDLDSDGVGDNTDVDRDGDSFNNSDDAFPDDVNEWADLDGDGVGNNSDTDIDGDGVTNNDDSFPLDNTESADLDGDGTGDNTDIDRDGDGVENSADAFPQDATETSDLDSDGIGDNSDTDIDGDGVLNVNDSFPRDGTESTDLDGDGTGDNSDADVDGDGVLNDQDAFPNDATESSDLDGDSIGDNTDTDRDGDGFGNTMDAFPNDATEWLDLDGDGIGNNTDLDRDGDGVSNDIEIQVGTDPNDASSVPEDIDNDGIPNALDDDRDGDGVLNLQDQFPDDVNESSDLDGDGIGDNADNDIDGDGALNEADAFPRDATEISDLDGDGVGDNADSDRDGDGIANDLDALPNNPEEWLDTDGDGIGNNTDTDLDGDGVENNVDAFPMDSSESADLDGDGIGDNSDADLDGDGVINLEDAFPNNPSETSDLDSDGIGDNVDTDIDGDGIANADDEFPFDSTENSDFDGDGIGDNSDTDIDNDNVINLEDAFPYDATESSDLDGDGIGDNTDTDRDGDGVNNDQDIFPNDVTETSDLDQDGIGDNADEDRDGDGFTNIIEMQLGSNPDDAASKPADFDADGIPDDMDTDIDGDNVNNENDSCPGTTQGADVDLNGCASTQRDSDSDGITDDLDQCPATVLNANVDELGCAIIPTSGLGELDQDNQLSGTVQRDFIISAGGNDEIRGLQSNDILLGGLDDDTYIINQDSGHDVISDVHGVNILKFIGGIDYSDLASGLTKSANDLILRINGGENSVRIENFFSIANTISIIEFESGGQITAGQLFSAFGLSPPIETDTSKDIKLGTNTAETLEGTNINEILMSGGGNDRLLGMGGNDYLVGGPGDDTYLIGRASGRDQIIDTDGQNQIYFNDGLVFNDVSSGLVKSGDDLILKVGAGGDQVIINSFFISTNVINEIVFETGGTISAGQLYGVFGVEAPIENLVIVDLLSSTNDGTLPDDDFDGVNNIIDLCPNTPPSTAVNADGCGLSQLDTDNDGISDELDQCPETQANLSVDIYGCANNQLDTDNDGVNDSIDQCPLTDQGYSVNSVGCAINQQDTDNDGVTDDVDLCLGTNSQAVVDINGCSSDQRDTDSDGVTDLYDQCPLTESNQQVNFIGCSASQIDTDNDGIFDDSDLDDDNDGVNDEFDAFPLDANETLDTDHDGLGNNFDGDDDNDGYLDINEISENTDPLNTNSRPGTLQRSTTGSLISKTGVNISYVSFDDGDLKSGLDRILIRDDFTEIVTDKMNTLKWTDNKENKEKIFTFSGARSYCSDLELGGIDNWRLPSIYELLSILDFSQAGASKRDPLIDQTFLNTYREDSEYQLQSYNYWSSRLQNNKAIVLGFRKGGLSQLDSNDIGSVRCVSGDNKFNPIFYRATDTVIDVNNQLMWQDTENVKTAKLSWSNSVQYCADLSLNGENDWRLPNANEGHLIVNELARPYSSAFINNWEYDFNDEPYWWSSTTDVYSSNHAWKFYGYNESSNNLSDYKSRNKLTRCVRDYHEPIVIIGGDRTVDFGDVVTFDGSRSFENKNRNNSNYEWFDSSATNKVSISDAPIFTKSDLSAGQHTISLVVTDKWGRASTHEFLLLVEGVEQAPIANAGLDQVVEQHSLVTLDGSLSSDDTGIERYEWREGDQILSTESIFSTYDLAVGQHQIKLTVVDVSGLTSTDTVIITITAFNSPPNSNAGSDIEAIVGSPIILNGSQSYDSDGSIVSWQWSIDGSIVGSQSSVTIDDLAVGNYVAELVVIDDLGKSAVEQTLISIILEPINLAPIANAGEDITITEGETVTISGTASYDPEGGSLIYQWVDQDRILLSRSESFSLNDLAPAEYIFELMVTDDLGLWSIDTVTVTVKEIQFNELTICPAQNVTDDSKFIDQHPENNIPWSSGSKLLVKEIEKGFNNARLLDKSVSQYLILPTQVEWDLMGPDDKGLYIINAERQARGIKPFDGIAPEVSSVSQYFSDYHIDNDAPLSHSADGSSIVDRLDTNSTIFNNRDAYKRPESLYGAHDATSPLDVNSEVINAIYYWLYFDKTPFIGAAWGHRDQILQTNLNENSGSLFSEGVVGFGTSAGMYDPLDENIVGSEYGSFIVFNVVDQSSTWDISTVESINTDLAQGCNTVSEIYIDESSVDLTQLESLEIESTNIILLLNDSISLVVTAVYNDGTRIDVSGSTQFDADDRSVISIESGLLTALNEGSTTIYAKVANITSNRITVTVGSAVDTNNLIGSKVEPFIEYVPDNSTITQYDPKLLSVYTGLVSDKDNAGIDGVQISFLNHPEYGTTTTDYSGRFVVAGPSGQQTVVFEKPGHLTIQRKAIGQSTSWTNVESVMLLPFDTRRTFIDFTSGETQVHESTVITDEFGSRKSTVIFNNISSATVKSADGQERELAEFWLSATEFETPESMPGPLPDNSVFTYCTELHVEGTQYNDTVIFNNNVVMFVDNFLGFEVGEIIPIGSFDMVESNWQASANGVVVRLLDDNNDGTVDGIDHNNDGIADDLNNNGQTSDDALGLGNYSAGDTLMWGTFNHFSPVDYNLAGSEDQAPSDIEMLLEIEDENNDETACTGSYVMPFQQSFHEDIPIAGTDLTLHYTSQRTKDYKHKINIKVSGNDINPDVLSMSARLEIAGKVYQQDFFPSANISAEFIWDGKDIKGKRPKGKVSGRIRVGYEYASTYQSVGIAGFSAFSAFPTMSGFPVAWNAPASRDTGIQTRQNFTTWKNSGIALQNTFESQVAEGWSISNVHEYDPAGTVYKGDGSVFEVATQSNVIKTGQSFSHLDGDDGYYQSGGKNIDYSITNNNTIIDISTGLEWQNSAEPIQSTTKAGAANYCENLTEANYSDWRQPTGKESSYAQTKSGITSLPNLFSATRKYFWTTTTYESGAAINAVCVRGESINTRYVENLKRNHSLDVVIDNDNGLMWQDSPENASVSNDFASSIQYCEALDHADFNDWRLPNINELLYVLPNNTFVNKTYITWPEDGPYLWDFTADYVRAYWSSTSHYSVDSNAWAIESNGFTSSSFNKDRALYTRCVRDDATASRMPYKFDSDGKHISTIDLDTGKQLIDFIYNDNSQLISLQDQFGNAISINRDADGTVTSIVAPDGQTTDLSISGDNDLGSNNLDSVSYENNTLFNFYYDGSLLTEKVDRNGHTYSHSFDADGRVTQTTDVEGGQWDFFDAKNQYGENRYGFNTAEGQLYETLRSVLENGDIQKVTTHKDGSIVTQILQADQLKETILSKGVSTVIDKVIDEKTQDEIPSVITVTQPNGLTSVTGLQKVYGENGADTSQHTVTLSMNNRTSTVVTNAKAGTVIITSAEGRISQQISDVDTLQLKTSTSSGLTNTSYEYDARGRIHYIITGDRTTIYDYSDANDRGNVSSITAPDGKITYFDYDLMDRVTKTIYPDGHATQTEYDNTGNAKTLVVPTIKEHAFTYSGVNKVKTQSTPLNETTGYVYDADRRLTQIDLPSGQAITNGYLNGKLDKTTIPEGIIDYNYMNGNQLSAINEGSESLSYGYNGNLLTDIIYDGELSSSIQQGYDTNFWINSLTYAGSSTSLGYDNDGLLTSLNGLTITRHPLHGLPTQVSNSKLNQVMEYNGYGESKGRTTTVNNKRTYDYGLTYNLIGQITGKTETLADGSSNTFVYGYDDKRRLISVLKNNIETESYDYDANGNRELKSNTVAGITDQVATFNIADQQQSDGDTQIEYDTNGRLSKKLNPINGGTAIEEYSYSSQGRLLSVIFKQADQTTNVTTTIKTISYKHNALGNRVAKLVDGSVVEKYLWLDKTTLLATYDQNDNLKQRFEYGLGHTPVKFTQNSTTYYITSDHLGSPRTITDESGSVIKALDYDSFGNVVSDSNESFEIPFGFAGGLKDSDTSLLRFGYRDYDPSIGRWTARDPIGFAGGDTNLYGYVASDPVNFLDSIGLYEVRIGPSITSRKRIKIDGGSLGELVYYPKPINEFTVFGKYDGEFKIDIDSSIKIKFENEWLKYKFKKKDDEYEFSCQIRF